MTTTVHDSGYKRLFSNKTIFRQLIQTFVEEAWVSRLDFDRAERLDKSFVSEHYKETEADIIYKVPLRDAEEVIYLCLLIEFQSDVQRFMVLRSLHYRCSFYMDFVLSNKNVRGLLLPAMFQLVLYNGDDKWTAPPNIDQLIETEVDLGTYGLHFEHLVIAENAYGKEWLAKVDNIIATLFLAEAHYDLPLLMEKLLSLYDTEPDRQAIMLFINWFRQLAAHGRLSGADFAQIEEQDLTREEVKSMLVKAFERERETIRKEGIDIGKKEGIDIGKKEGIDIGKKEGIDIGKKEGIDIGKKEGIDIGKKEGITERNRQIVQAMIANGLPLPTIATLLVLPLSEIEHLLVEPGTTANVENGQTNDRIQNDLG